MPLVQILTEIPQEKEWKKLAGRLAAREVILASGSPRRRYLFEQMEIPFRVFPSEVDEEMGILEVGDPARLALELAEKKALYVLKKSGGDVVIGADTVVVLDGKIFGKPKSKKEAFEFLGELSGKRHTVYTGICVLTSSKKACGVEKTDVYFYDVGVEAIRAYIQSGEGLDKAGAYGIQGMGSFLVEKIRGPLDNVVGLPRLKLLELMKKVV